MRFISHRTLAIAVIAIGTGTGSPRTPSAPQAGIIRLKSQGSGFMAPTWAGNRDETRSEQYSCVPC